MTLKAVYHVSYAQEPTNTYLYVDMVMNPYSIKMWHVCVWCELVVKGEIVRCGDTLANMVCACVCLHGC